MKFDLTQRFSSPADAVTAAYADADLYPTLIGLPNLGGIEVLSRQEQDRRVDLRVRFRYTGDLPPGATAIVDPAKLTWVQETGHDLATGLTSFRLVPDNYPDRLQASGRLVVAADGAGSTRTLTAELKVRAALVAGRVERALVDGLREYLAAEAPHVDGYIAGRAGS